MTNLKFKVLTAGSCKQIEKLTNLTKQFRNIDFPAHFFLIQHPEEGYILVDTGYSNHFFESTKKLPYSIYAKTTPVAYATGMSAKEQLNRMGIQNDEIKKIFITHFHADHISGLKDFPKAKFICSQKAYDFVKDKSGIKALKNAFVPSLLPEGFEERVMFIEDGKKVKNELLGNFETVYDVIGDESMLSFDLSGHAHGQMGLFFKTKQSSVLLAADSAWDSSAVRNFELPSFATKFIMSDYRSFKNNLKKLHVFHKQNPEVLIIPSHCREIKGELI